MIRPTLIDTRGDPARIAAVAVHHPDGGSLSRSGAAENNAASIGGLARPEIPDPLLRRGELRHFPVRRIPSTHLRPTPRLLRFVIAIEVVGVRPLGPWNSHATLDPGRRRGKRISPLRVQAG